MTTDGPTFLILRVMGPDPDHGPDEVVIAITAERSIAKDELAVLAALEQAIEETDEELLHPFFGSHKAHESDSPWLGCTHVTHVCEVLLTGATEHLHWREYLESQRDYLARYRVTPPTWWDIGHAVYGIGSTRSWELYCGVREALTFPSQEVWDIQPQVVGTLGRLKRRGLVERRGDYGWAITPEGDATLADRAELNEPVRAD